MIPYKLISGDGVHLSKFHSVIGIGHQLPILRVNSLFSPCSIRERILDRFPWLYYLDSDGNIYKVVGIEAEQLCLIQSMIGVIEEQHWVDDAEGVGLENIGSLVGCYRMTDETDTSFRLRIKNIVPTLYGGGTIPALRQALASILGIVEAELQINDGYLRDAAYGHFNACVINHDATLISDERWDLAVTTVNEKKAAGVMFDGFSNQLENDITVDCIGGNFHVTGITKTESLNVTTGAQTWK